MDDARDVIFYDGGCGLCHGFVKFVAPRDDLGRFHFAPLGGATFERLVAAPLRVGLPDSVVVRRPDGQILVKSDAALYVLGALGGLYGLLGRLSRAFPKTLRDWAYDGIARIRRTLFAAPEGVCPIMPPALRPRFHD